jgi:peroxiredoxin Q/BCP
VEDLFMRVKALLRVGLAAAMGLLSSATGRTQAPVVELKVGDAAPAFSLPASDGKTHSLAESKGKTVVLAWFPKAFTAG